MCRALRRSGPCPRGPGVPGERRSSSFPPSCLCQRQNRVVSLAQGSFELRRAGLQRHGRCLAPVAALEEIDAAAEVGEPGGVSDGIGGGREGAERQRRVQDDRDAVLGEDHGPERREEFEAGSAEEEA